MKTPPDHITIHFPANHRTPDRSAYIWRRAQISRPMTFMTLVFLSYPEDSLERRLAARWLLDFKTSSRLSFMATMAAMFGVQWLQSDDPRVLSIRHIGTSSCPQIDPEQAGLWMPFMLAMVGQIKIRILIDLIEANPALWQKELPRIGKIPGSSQLLSDIEHILAGESDRVSWAQPKFKKSVIPHLSERSLNMLRPGDAIVLDPASRKMSLSELLRRATAIAALLTNSRKFYQAITTEFIEKDMFCVVIRRMR